MTHGAFCGVVCRLGYRGVGNGVRNRRECFDAWCTTLACLLTTAMSGSTIALFSRARESVKGGPSTTARVPPASLRSRRRAPRLPMRDPTMSRTPADIVRAILESLSFTPRTLYERQRVAIGMAHASCLPICWPCGDTAGSAHKRRRPRANSCRGTRGKTLRAGVRDVPLNDHCA